VASLDEDLVALARRIDAALLPPPVGRVVLPVRDGDALRGSFCAVQLADGSTGLSFVLLGDTREQLARLDPAPLAGRGALPLAERLPGGDAGTRAIALAAVNALARHLLDRARFTPDLATNSLGSLPLGPGDRLGMVGFFPPLVQRARDAGIPLTVLELKEELVQETPGLVVTLDPARLAECNKIVCTSATILNGSLDGLLPRMAHAAELVVVGPSATCVPDALFARGVTAVGGAWVTDPAALAERIGRGDPWGGAARKFSVRRDAGWPGAEELLRRAAGYEPVRRSR
jgi:hypothetical protein